MFLSVKVEAIIVWCRWRAISPDLLGRSTGREWLGPASLSRRCGQVKFGALYYGARTKRDCAELPQNPRL